MCGCADDVHGVRLGCLQLAEHEAPLPIAALKKPPNGIITCVPEARSGQTCRQGVRTQYLRLAADMRAPQCLRLRA
jgi:hypothetical protein